MGEVVKIVNILGSTLKDFKKNDNQLILKDKDYQYAL